MSVQAVGAYIQALAQRHGLTIAAVTAEAGVNQNYVWRLIHGNTNNPAAITLAKLVQCARGDYVQAMRLLLDDAATEQDGLEAAQKPDDEDAPFARLPAHQRKLLLDLARELLRESGSPLP